MLGVGPLLGPSRIQFELLQAIYDAPFFFNMRRSTRCLFKGMVWAIIVTNRVDGRDACQEYADDRAALVNAHGHVNAAHPSGRKPCARVHGGR